MRFNEVLPASEQPYQEANDALQARLWTAIPGIIETYDPAKQTATVRPTIRAVRRMPDGSSRHIDLPICPDVLVQFPSGGGASLTFPVKKGDECLLVFSCRSIDNWWQGGGVQNQYDARMHDLSDGFALLGFRSFPRVLSNVSTSSVQLRSDDGSTVVDFNPEGTVSIACPTKIVMTSPEIEVNGLLKVINEGQALQVTGNTKTVGDVEVDGSVDATVDVVAVDVSLKAHVHGGVRTGDSQTGYPFS